MKLGKEYENEADNANNINNSWSENFPFKKNLKVLTLFLSWSEIWSIRNIQVVIHVFMLITFRKDFGWLLSC